MKFAYAPLLIVFLMIAGCHNTQNNLPNNNQQTAVQQNPVTADDGKVQCSGNTWSTTGYEPNCTACPDNATVSETKTSCTCNDSSWFFSLYENKCQKKLTPAQSSLLLL